MVNVFHAVQGVTITLGTQGQFAAEALAAVEAISPPMALTTFTSCLDVKHALESIIHTDLLGGR